MILASGSVMTLLGSSLFLDVVMLFIGGEQGVSGPQSQGTVQREFAIT